MKQYIRWISCTAVLCLIMSCPVFAQNKYDPFSKAGTGSSTRKQDSIASLEFVDTPITTIFRMVSDLTGWSIITSPSVSQKPPKLNIWVKNLTPQQVLEHVANLGELVLERKGSIVKVMTFEEYAHIYGVEKRVVRLRHAKAKAVAQILKSFVEKNEQGRIIPDEGGNKIVLLVGSPLMESLVKLIETLDTPFAGDVVRVVVLKHQEASMLAQALEEFLTEQAKGFDRNTTSRTGGKSPIEGAQQAQAGARWLVTFMAEPKLNVIILRGMEQDVSRTIELIRRLDARSDIVIQSYELQYTNAHDVHNTIRELLREDERTLRGRRSRLGNHIRLRVSVSEQNNRIIVEGSQDDQKRLASIIEAIDKPLPPGSGGMRVYCLENTSAEIVAKVLNDLVQDRQRQGGTNLAKQQPQRTTENNVAVKGKTKALNDSSGKDHQLSAGDILPPSISVAPDINAVVINASAAKHEELGKIIRSLDKPRKQVMLEVSLVTVRSDRTFNLGVDIGYGHILENGVQQLGFTTFGIGNVDPNTGAVKINGPAFGLNYGILNFRDFSFVLRALKTVGNVHIVSSPKLLVEDNTEGLISQFNQEPYEVISQGEDSTVKSFGGFVDAGTTLAVKPSIAEDGWLRLAYSISLSAFGNRTAQQQASNLPPPRRETKTQGTVRIPEDHMVVLGGLTANRNDENEDAAPFLADIPILGELFKNRSRSRTQETLYIFVRPVILRDTKFRDLLYLSQKDVRKARLRHSRYPRNWLKMLVEENAACERKEPVK